MHAKRVVVEAEWLLTAQELAACVGAHFECPHGPPNLQEKAS